MIYLWKLDREIRGVENVLTKIKSPTKVKFDISIVKYFNNAELKDFREKFIALIVALRNKPVVIDYDAIRIQSIKYNCLLIGPKTINLGIIRKCNYKCVFCRFHGPFAQGEYPNNTEDNVPFRDIVTIIEQTYKMGTEAINLSGEGEPLMHPEIMDIISYISKYRFKLTILTNMSTFDIIPKILRLPNNLNLSFLVNMSAVNTKKYKQIYNQNASNFYKVLRFAECLNKKFPVCLNYIVMKDNLQDMRNFVSLAKRLGIRSLSFKFPILDYERYKSILISKKESVALLNTMNEIIRFSNQCHIKVNFERLLPFFRQQAFAAVAKNCYSGWRYSSIAPDGNVYNCCIYNKPIGKIIAGNFKKVYFSESSLNRCIEGKKQIAFNSVRWSRCKICRQIERNILIHNILNAQR